MDALGNAGMIICYEEIFLYLYGCMNKSFFVSYVFVAFESPHDKTNKVACAPSEDSDQPGRLPSLIRVFAVCSMGS